MHKSLITIFTVSAILIVAFYFVTYVIYIDNLLGDAPLDAAPQAILVLVASVLVFVVWLVWECAFGTAFRYCAPSHGLRRPTPSSWRAGVLLKAAISALVIDLLATFLFSQDFESFKIHDLRALTPLEPLDVLLVPVCLAGPIFVLVLYALAAFACGGGAGRRPHNI
jgi:magnesium-transporting ATPase (P-type)